MQKLQRFFQQESLTRDIVVVLLFLAVPVAAFYLATLGLGIIMFIGFTVPGWIILLLFLLVFMRKKKRRRQ